MTARKSSRFDRIKIAQARVEAAQCHLSQLTRDDDRFDASLDELHAALDARTKAEEPLK
jgi:hypothetical protein